MGKKHASKNKEEGHSRCKKSKKVFAENYRPSPYSFSAFMRWDEETGERMFRMRDENRLIKTASDLLSLSGDEVIFFGIVTPIAISMSFARGWGYLRDIGCVEEALWDCFGSSAVCTFVESMLKLLFKRKRPKYCSQSHFISIVGEWYSFPSGHSIRAFYFIFWISRSKFVQLLRHFLVIPRARSLIPWAIGVGWSRVAKGRHYPVDVVVGCMIGFVLGWLVEDYFSGYGRAIAKTIAGTFTVANWAYYILVPFIAGDNKTYSAIVTVCFYIYTLSLLFTSLPASFEIAGAQTIQLEDDGLGCKNFW